METPSSARMVTRSQVSKNSVTTSSKESARQRKIGQALIDITNDSPIVGLTSGSLKTPLTSSARKGMSTRSKVTITPGSGEALLRGQVKNLLQMVEEETELQKLQLPCRPFVGIYRALADLPIALLAPANTPQVHCSGEQQMPSPIVQDPIFISQEVNGGFDDARKEECFEAKSPLTRSLMLEFLEKDDSECHSTVTNLEVVESGGSNGKSVVNGDDDVDDSSTWSTQVNASIKDEEEDAGDYLDVDPDELCSEMSSLSVHEATKKLPESTGKHIRFVYDSDDE